METLLEFVEKWEWLLLIGVGFLEAWILIKVYQEKRERATLIEEMRSTRIELGRESYLAMIKETLANAEKEVFFVSHSLTVNMTDREKDSVFSLYHPKCDHRCVTGRDPGKIREMWEQHRHGVDVRVNDLVMQSTFRYQICDGDVAVLGFAEGGDEASRKGIRIENIYFARVLRQHFLTTWNESQPFLNYVRELLAKPRATELAPTLSDIAAEWGLSVEEQKLVEGKIEERAQPSKVEQKAPEP